MKSGLLWFDNSDTALLLRIQSAQARYREKFSVAANTVYVHPTEETLAPEAFARCRDLLALNDVALLTKVTVQPKHIWLGRKEPLEVIKAVAANYAGE